MIHKQFQNCKICNSNTELINATHNLVKCNKCQFIFCNTVFSQEEFIRVYDKLYNNKNSPYQRHSATEYSRLKDSVPIKIGYNRGRLIKKYILNGKCESVLEIGSGVGLIGCYLREQSSSLDYLGIEIDKETFEKSKGLGLNVRHGDFNEMTFVKKKYDVIMLWEVIEHLQDLKLFLNLAYKTLNKGGIVVLSAPNYDRIYNVDNINDNLFQDSPPIHLNFFTKGSIVNVFNSQKFKTLEINEKKIPYLELNKFSFYKNILRSVFNKYNGPTLYYAAKKE